MPPECHQCGQVHEGVGCIASHQDWGALMDYQRLACRETSDRADAMEYAHECLLDSQRRQAAGRQRRATVQGGCRDLIAGLDPHANEVLDGTPWHKLWLLLDGRADREQLFWAGITQSRQKFKLVSHIREHAKYMVARGQAY